PRTMPSASPAMSLFMFPPPIRASRRAAYRRPRRHRRRPDDLLLGRRLCARERSAVNHRHIHSDLGPSTPEDPHTTRIASRPVRRVRFPPPPPISTVRVEYIVEIRRVVGRADEGNRP